MKLADLPEGTCEVAVVVHEYVRQRMDGACEICLRTREARYEFVVRHVVASLKYAHRHTLLRDLDTVDADVAEDDRVALLGRCFAQELHLVAHWIGEDGLEHEALALLHQRLAQLVRKKRGLPGVDVELARQLVGIHEAQGGRREMHRMERRLAGAVRSGDGDDDRPRIEGRGHFDLTGLNTRFTKRPTRRVPSSSILTRNPGRPGAGSKCGYGRDARCAARRRRPWSASTESRHSESGRPSPRCLSRRTSSVRSASSVARPRRAQNSIWLAIERSVISPARRASRTRASESLTG